MSMYRIKPLSVVPDSVELPKCMYHIKPLNKMTLESLSDLKRVELSPELQAIEDRQLKIISKLRLLRDNVDAMIRRVGAGQAQQHQQTPPVKLNASPAQIYDGVVLKNVEVPSEIVIEANPLRPPLSLLFFQKLGPSIRIVTHTHSSCNQIVDQKLQNLFARDTVNFTGTVRVVWKNGPDCRLTPTNLGSSGIEGESNVARYLSRVLAPSDSPINYDAVPLEDLVLVDNVLRSSDLIDTSPEQFLTSLQVYVQRKNRGVRTVADFVGYSSLRYFLTQQQPKNPLQKSLVDWMNCLTNEGLC